MLPASVPARRGETTEWREKLFFILLHPTPRHTRFVPATTAFLLSLFWRSHFFPFSGSLFLSLGSVTRAAAQYAVSTGPSLPVEMPRGIYSGESKSATAHMRCASRDVPLPLCGYGQCLICKTISARDPVRRLPQLSLPITTAGAANNSTNTTTNHHTPTSVTFQTIPGPQSLKMACVAVISHF